MERHPFSLLVTCTVITLDDMRKPREYVALLLLTFTRNSPPPPPVPWKHLTGMFPALRKDTKTNVLYGII